MRRGRGVRESRKLESEERSRRWRKLREENGRMEVTERGEKGRRFCGVYL